MSFDVPNGVVKIDGNIGKYGSGANSSKKYGQNSVDNYYTYIAQGIDNYEVNPLPKALDKSKNLEQIEKEYNNFIEKNNKYLDSLPPLEYEYRYMNTTKKGEIDKNAVLGAAYEELGHQNEVSVEAMDKFIANPNLTAKSLDINQDGKISTSEYATSIIAADMMSKRGELSLSKVDGTINKKGHKAVMSYAQKNKINEARKLYTNIYYSCDFKEPFNDYIVE